MKIKTLLLVLCLLIPSAVFAQAINPSTATISWDYAPAALSNVQGFHVCIDQTDAAIAASTAVCMDLGLPAAAVTTATLLTYTVPFPAVTPGTHSLVITAYNPVGQTASNRVTFNVFVVPPAPPTNLRITIKPIGG